MELVNKSVNNAIHFILCVQDSCDKHRKCMENVWNQEYTLFVTEWKQNQNEIKRQVEKTSDNSSHKDDLEELEELALADSLLERARNIRIKNQKLINGIVEYKTMSSTADFGVVTKKSSNSTHTLEKNKVNKKMPQSKSDLAIKIYSRKNIVVPRSKSATASLVPKDDTKSRSKNKHDASVSSKCGAVNHSKSSEKTATDNSAVISNKDLNVLKRLHVSLPTSHEFKSKNVVSFSDSSEDKNQNQILPYPSSKEFLSKMKGRLNTASSHVKLKLWYPFLSSKSEVFLTAVGCNTFCSLKKACSILYSIQETMMWLDLLYLMEKEIYPALIFDTNDVNMLRICSYLLSIFHPSSQRIPILNPNR